MVRNSVNFKLTPQAVTDLKEIARNTRKNWGVNQRNKYIAELDRCFNFLAENPYRGKDRSEINQGYRSKIQGSHVVFYIINGDYIEIIGLPHVREDLEIVFGDKASDSSPDDFDLL